MPERSRAGSDPGEVFGAYVATEFEPRDLDAARTTIAGELYVTQGPTPAGGVGGAGFECGQVADEHIHTEHIHTEHIHTEHIHWGQASPLVQVGALDGSDPPVIRAEQAAKALDPNLPINRPMDRARRVAPA